MTNAHRPEVRFSAPEL
jgi:SAM-dependent methyltransferase